MKSLNITAIVLLLATSIPARIATAASSGLHKHTGVGTVGEVILKLHAGSAYFLDIPSGTTQTTDQNGLYEAIIDVFSYPDRSLIDESKPGYDVDTDTYQNANISLAATTADRIVYVIVRPSGEVYSGQVTLRMRQYAGAVGAGTPTGTHETQVFLENTPYSAQGASPILEFPLGLVANTRVWTTQENYYGLQGPGEGDTILMVLQDDSPLAFDDDSGLARMSWLSLSGQCHGSAVPPLGHHCTVFVANVLNDKLGSSFGHAPRSGNPGSAPHTTVGVDEDVGNGLDRDQDGLGDAFEVAIGTCDQSNPNRDTDGDGIPDCNDPDVDGDGIPDNVEVKGVDDSSGQETDINLTTFPYYGADPLKPDLFAEMDWVPGCDVSTPLCTPAILDTNRFTQAQEALLATIFPPEIAVHIDGGHSDPNNGTAIGDWGGASVLSWADGTTIPRGYCTGMSPGRDGYFTHLLASFLNPQNRGRCSQVQSSRVSATAHEMGHYFGLMHGGDPNTPENNCNPNYLSIMNYAFSELAQVDLGTGITWFAGAPSGSQLSAFSRGAHAGFVLNPFSLNEVAGLGTVSDPNALNFYGQRAGMKVDSTTGAIDWNRNGKIDSTIVKGMVDAPIDDAGDCSFSPPVKRSLTADKSSIAQVGLPTLYVESGALNLAALTPAGSGAGASVGILIGAQPNFAACATAGINSCVTLPTAQTQKTQRTILPNPAPGLFAPAVAGGVVVYADASGNMNFFTEASVTGSTATVTAVGGPAISGDPVAVERPSGMVSVFAPSGGNLLRWDYHPALNQWTTVGAAQFWGPATPPGAPVQISALSGIGITWGYQRSLPGQAQFTTSNLYAAILTLNAAGNRTVAFARLDGAETQVPPTVPGSPVMFSLPNQWVELPSTITGLTSPMNTTMNSNDLVASRLGLAFRPEDPSAAAPQPGRFYVTWQKTWTGPADGIYENEVLMSYTRGNVYSDITSLVGVEEALTFNNATTFGNGWSTFASGVSLAYFDGGVRGAAQTTPAPKAPWIPATGTFAPLMPLVSMAAPASDVFPNVDGIFNADHSDHDDVSFIKSHLSWAVKR